MLKELKQKIVEESSISKYGYGLRIFESDHAVRKVLKQVRFCRSKRKRIIKKWRTNPNNYNYTNEPCAYKTPQGLMVHSSLMPFLRNATT